MKFRKKPIIVDAFQMTKERWDTADWPNWLVTLWYLNPEDYPAAMWVENSKEERILIGTAKNPYTVNFNDWIIKDPFGDHFIEISVCDPKTFARTYEVV